jgi:hypothetical protein
MTRPIRTAQPSFVRLGSALSLAAAIVLLSAVPGATAPMPAGMAWIDQPLPGTTHPLGEMTVTVHATDPAGVAAIHLWVGDAAADSETLNDPEPILASAELAWTPDEPGSYLLTARAVSISGEWGQPASVIVTIDADAGGPSAEPSGSPDASASNEPGASAEPDASAAARPTPGAGTTPAPRATTAPTPRPTAAPTPRPTPAPTPRPTPAPCAPAPPVLTAPPSGATITDPAQNPPTFAWAHRTPPACPPTGYRVQVFGPDGNLILDVTLGNVTQWTPGAPLDNCISYSWRVATRGTTFGPWSAPSSLTISIRC